MINSYLEKLVSKYKQKGIFVDTGILTLYIVGSLDASLVSKFGRTAGFSENDFITVSEFIDAFEIKITTPHILTEVNNFVDSRSDLLEVLRGYMASASEKVVSSSEIAENHAFLKFGLSDSSIIHVAQGKYLVFTNDSRFLGYLRNNGIDAVSLDELLKTVRHKV
jgi:rRNA-processing protein FCF1